MKLADIIANLPKEGATCGLDIPTESSENWMDHALEKLACEALSNDDPFKAGMVTAMQAMTIAMTLDKVDWAIIKDALSAMTAHMD